MRKTNNTSKSIFHSAFSYKASLKKKAKRTLIKAKPPEKAISKKKAHAKTQRIDFSPPNPGFRYFFLLLFVIVLFIASSIALRVWYATQNNFFNSPSFTVLFWDEKATILKVNTEKRTLSVLTIDRLPPDLLTHSNKVSLATGIPIDAVAICNGLNIDDYKSIMTFGNIVSVIRGGFSCQLLNANSYDIVKLIITSYFASKVTTVEVKEVPSTLNPSYEDYSASIYDLFSDSKIISDNVTVEIINASGVEGLATRLSTFLKNEGFNIISLRSSPSDKKSKVTVFNEQKNYSVRRLLDLIDISSISENIISPVDVSIVIDQEYAQKVLGYSIEE